MRCGRTAQNKSARHPVAMSSARRLRRSGARRGGGRELRADPATSRASGMRVRGCGERAHEILAGTWLVGRRRLVFQRRRRPGQQVPRTREQKLGDEADGWGPPGSERSCGTYKG
ncbi:hypothetical protein GQ55_4G320600 [Panicum hallii var. hallii]|uniref:Uncharacterized protein n=1 Tax=Panicum hallii var. hallii TaxID=1504633 RepID=A0A2T7E2D5_9POAL|nr:hypothetical protein GQ55_4G320600 [Panicum hallii var. hallii]